MCLGNALGSINLGERERKLLSLFNALALARVK